jgi:hypothetical protein
MMESQKAEFGRRAFQNWDAPLQVKDGDTHRPMRRCEQLDHIAEAVGVDRGTVIVVAREAGRNGLLDIGPRGRNAPPYTETEVIQIITRIAIARCVGGINASFANDVGHLDIVFGSNNGLTVSDGTRGIRTSVNVPQSAVRNACRCASRMH